MFQLPSRLTIFESPFANAAGLLGVIGGPHRVFTEGEKQLNGNYTNMQSYFTDMLQLYRYGYKVSLDVPLLNCKPFDEVTCDGSVENEYMCKKAFPNQHTLKMEKFRETESAGTDVSYRCVKCRDCQIYTENQRFENISVHEEIEQHLIECEG